jgi:hypothetical protein
METVRAIDPALNAIGALHYFHDDVVTKSKEAGVGPFRMYVIGRGGVLGDVEAKVVRSAFGYFNPVLLDKLWNTGRERMGVVEAADRYLDWSADLGRKLFAGVEHLEPFNEAAAAVIAAADPSGLPLFAGFALQSAPEDPAAAAFFHAIVLRELRGSVHLAAVVASGLESRMAHKISRPNDLELFGWEELPEPTEEQRRRHAEACQATDVAMAVHYSLVSAEQRQALAAGTEALQAALA